MGGRLDATNVTEPLASAIVSLDFDHQAYLGRTLSAIAREKAGVLRGGRTTILGPLAAPARRAIEARARATGARLVEAGRGVAWRAGAGGLEACTARGRYRGLRPLPGAHQRDNLLVALRMLEAAKAAGLPVNLRRVGAGGAGTRRPRPVGGGGRPPPPPPGRAHNPPVARGPCPHPRAPPPLRPPLL